MRIAICDSDCQERDKYLDIIRALVKKNNIDAEFIIYSKCEEMLFHIEDKTSMDVLFLEIEMPDMPGFEAAKKLRESHYKGEIVFLTKMTEKQPTCT